MFLLKDFENNKNLKILKATYGFADRTIDMTDSLNLKIIDDKLIARAKSKVDPYRNKVKTMKIKYSYYGFIDTLSIREGKEIRLPKI